MDKEKTYNGWTNYETWNVALWLGNDSGSVEYWDEQAKDALKHAKTSYESQTGQEAATCKLAEMLKDEIVDGEFAPKIEGMYADLLNAALSDVNWYEIAEHMVNDAAEAIS